MLRLIIIIIIILLLINKIKKSFMEFLLCWNKYFIAKKNVTFIIGLVSPNFMNLFWKIIFISFQLRMKIMVESLKVVIILLLCALDRYNYTHTGLSIYKYIFIYLNIINLLQMKRISSHYNNTIFISNTNKI